MGGELISGRHSNSSLNATKNGVISSKTVYEVESVVKIFKIDTSGNKTMAVSTTHLKSSRITLTGSVSTMTTTEEGTSTTSSTTCQSPTEAVVWEVGPGAHPLVTYSRETTLIQILLGVVVITIQIGTAMSTKIDQEAVKCGMFKYTTMITVGSHQSTMHLTRCRIGDTMITIAAMTAVKCGNLFMIQGIRTRPWCRDTFLILSNTDTSEDLGPDHPQSLCSRDFNVNKIFRENLANSRVKITTDSLLYNNITLNQKPESLWALHNSRGLSRLENLKLCWDLLRQTINFLYPGSRRTKVLTFTWQVFRTVLLRIQSARFSRLMGL